MGRLRPLAGAVVVTCALAACTHVPARVADQFQADDNPARNHYLKADPEAEASSDGAGGSE